MEKKVLLAASSYNQKYYFNPEFSNLPDLVKKELKIISVKFTEDKGGILIMEFDGDGSLHIKSSHEETDYLYDEIDAGLSIDRLAREKKELFEKLELYVNMMEKLKDNPASDDLKEASLKENASEDDGFKEDGFKEDQTDLDDMNLPRDSWDMPVYPEDEDAEFTAYRFLFGEDTEKY